MRVLVAAWVGSTNLGDELVFAGLTRLLRERGAVPVAVSVDPAGTAATHAVEAVGTRDVWRTVRASDAVVLGGGGLLQDETSPFNLPYHLWRVVAARARRTPFAGIGLGAGRLDTRLGRRLVRHALRRAVGVSVRDADSARLLADVGVPGAVVAADLAFALPSRDVGAADRLVVCLRPWGGRRGRLPAALRAKVAATPEASLQATARALDEAAAATGLAVHFVALQPDRDGPLHEQVAARMATPATLATPDVHGLVAEVATGRAVVSMRYHGGVAAALAGRPAVLVGYSPKVDALAADLGAGARLLPWRAAGPAGVAAAVQAVLPQADAVGAALATLRARQEGNGEVLDRLLSAAAAAARP